MVWPSARDHYLAGVLLVAILFSVPALGQHDAGSFRVPTSADFAGAGYGEFWSARLRLESGDAVVAAYLLDENLYVRSQAGLIYAVQVDTGLLRWVHDLEERFHVDRPPWHVESIAGAGPVVFTLPDRVVFVDRFSGEVVGRVELPVPAVGAAVATMNTLYVGGSDQNLYAIRWSLHCRGPSVTLWRVGLAGMVRGRPVLTFDGDLIVASERGRVYRMGGRDKHLIWAFGVGGAITGGMAVADSAVYVSAADQRFYMLDFDSGRLIEEELLPSGFATAPFSASGFVYQYCENRGIYSFDTQSHRRSLHIPAARSFVAQGSDKIVFVSETGSLIFANSTSGEIVGIIELPRGSVVPANSRDSVIFLCTADGKLICAKPLGFPYLRREQVTAARVELHAPPGSADNEDEGLPSDAGGQGVLDRGNQTDPLRSRLSPGR